MSGYQGWSPETASNEVFERFVGLFEIHHAFTGSDIPAGDEGSIQDLETVRRVAAEHGLTDGEIDKAAILGKRIHRYKQILVKARDN